MAAFMEPLQYDLRSPAAKDNGITNAATARSNLDAAICICRDWVAKHNRTTRNGVGNCSSKTGWISTPERKKDDFEALSKRIFRRKITSAKMEKICWQITVAAFMEPLQYDLRGQLQKTIVLRMQPQHEATLTQPLQCDLQRLSCKTQ